MFPEVIGNVSLSIRAYTGYVLEMAGFIVSQSDDFLPDVVNEFVANFHAESDFLGEFLAQGD